MLLLMIAASPAQSAGPLGFDIDLAPVEGPPYPSEGIVSSMQLCVPPEPCVPVADLVVQLFAQLVVGAWLAGTGGWALRRGVSSRFHQRIRGR
jgi:hypothetical protein